MRIIQAALRKTLVSHRSISRRTLLQSALGFAGAVTFGSLIAACRETATDDAAGAEEEIVEDNPEDGAQEASVDEVISELPDDFEPPDSPELDLDTLEFTLAAETVEAESYDNTYVGEVTEDLFIAISVGSRYLQGPDEVAVYLCDNEIGIYLTGEMDDSDEATLSNEEAEVELAIEDGEIVGNVTLAGEEAQSFTAVEASDDAGLYVAELSVDDVDVTQRWIVLPDGQQRGNNICCVTHPRTGQRVCYPCWHLN